jgi:hypothetical protein
LLTIFHAATSPSAPLTPQEYQFMLKTYILTFVAGLVICGSAIGIFIVLGVYASWLIMFVRCMWEKTECEIVTTSPRQVVAMLCFPLLLGLGYGALNLSRRPRTALLGVGLLVGMFGGVIAGISFSYYNEVCFSSAFDDTLAHCLRTGCGTTDHQREHDTACRHSKQRSGRVASLLSCAIRQSVRHLRIPARSERLTVLQRRNVGLLR